MLVLSRKVGERVLVGDSIVITVLATRGQVTKIGIEAPNTFVVLREEIALAAHSSPGDPEGMELLPVIDERERRIHGRNHS